MLEFLGNVNLFHGRVELRQGRLPARSSSTISTAASATDGTPARLLVRPHELDIHSSVRADDGALAGSDSCTSWPAGPQVRVDLIGETGEALKVEMPQSRFHEQSLQTGQDVFVSVREPRVYLGDYSI